MWLGINIQVPCHDLVQPSLLECMACPFKLLTVELYSDGSFVKEQLVVYNTLAIPPNTEHDLAEKHVWLGHGLGLVINVDLL